MVEFPKWVYARAADLAAGARDRTREYPAPPPLTAEQLEGSCLNGAGLAIAYCRLVEQHEARPVDPREVEARARSLDFANAAWPEPHEALHPLFFDRARYAAYLVICDAQGLEPVACKDWGDAHA